MIKPDVLAPFKSILEIHQAFRVRDRRDRKSISPFKSILEIPIKVVRIQTGGSNLRTFKSILEIPRGHISRRGDERKSDLSNLFWRFRGIYKGERSGADRGYFQIYSGDSSVVASSPGVVLVLRAFKSILEIQRWKPGPRR